MKIVLYITCLFFCSFSVFSKGAFRPSSDVVGAKILEIGLLGSIFNTSGYYEHDGTFTELDEGEGYTKIDVDVITRYGFGNRFEARGGIRYRSNTSSTASEDVVYSDLESYFAGFKYSFLPYQNIHYAFDFQFRQTLYENTEYSSGAAPDDEIILGDDGTEITTGVHLSYKTKGGFYLAGHLAYNMPPNEMSNEILYNCEGGVVFKKFTVSGGLNGVYSLVMDEFGDATGTKPSMSTGRTRLYNSINRELIAPYVGIAVSPSPSWYLSLSASRVIMGTSTDQGDQIKAVITWRSSGVSKSDVKIGTFKEYDLEARVIKLSPREKFVKIDQGMSGDVVKGMKIDIYKTDYFGKNILIASGVVFKVGADTAIVKIVKMYKKVSIQKGFVARGY